MATNPTQPFKPGVLLGSHFRKPERELLGLTADVAPGESEAIDVDAAGRQLGAATVREYLYELQQAGAVEPRCFQTPGGGTVDYWIVNPARAERFLAKQTQWPTQATVVLPPMSEREAEVSKIIRSSPEPITGKQICNILGIEAKSLCRPIKALKKRGLKNRRGVGYYFDTDT